MLYERLRSLYRLPSRCYCLVKSLCDLLPIVTDLLLTIQRSRCSQASVQCLVATASSQGRPTVTATSGLAVTEVTSSTSLARARRAQVKWSTIAVISPARLTRHTGSR